MYKIYEKNYKMIKTIKNNAIGVEIFHVPRQEDSILSNFAT
jgi:hypothetical protein